MGAAAKRRPEVGRPIPRRPNGPKTRVEIPPGLGLGCWSGSPSARPLAPWKFAGLFPPAALRAPAASGGTGCSPASAARQGLLRHPSLHYPLADKQPAPPPRLSVSDYWRFVRIKNVSGCRDGNPKRQRGMRAIAGSPSLTLRVRGPRQPNSQTRQSTGTGSGRSGDRVDFGSLISPDPWSSARYGGNVREHFGRLRAHFQVFANILQI